MGDVVVKGSWLSENSIELDLVRDGNGGWVGEWSLVFVDPDANRPGGLSQSRIHLTGDVVPAWGGPENVEWVTGETGEAQFALTRLGTGEVIPADQFGGRARLSADLILRGQEPRPILVDDQGQRLYLSGAAIETPQTVDLTDVPIGPASVRLTLDLTTKGVRGGQGTALQPQSVEVPVMIVPPADYPSVLDQVIDLGRLDDLKGVTGTIAAAGPGCVWLAEEAESTTLPEGVEPPSLTSEAHSQDTCIEVLEGVEGELPFSLDFDALGNGEATGVVTVMTHPLDGEADDVALPVQVRYTLALERPRDTDTFVGLLILITAAGILIPLLLLYFVKWLAAGIPGSSLLVGRLSGVVGADGRFIPASGDLSLEATAMDSTFLSGNRRHAILTGGGELDSKIGLNPGAAGYVVAHFDGRGAASSHARASTKKLDAWLPTGVAGSWIVVLSGPEAQAAAELVVLTNERADGLDRLMSDAKDRMPDVVATLRERLLARGSSDSAPPPPDNSGGWGGASPPAGGAGGQDGWDGGSDWGGTPSAPPPAPPPPGGSGNTGGW